MPEKLSNCLKSLNIFGNKGPGSLVPQIVGTEDRLFPHCSATGKKAAGVLLGLGLLAAENPSSMRLRLAPGAKRHRFPGSHVNFAYFLSAPVLLLFAFFTHI